MLSDIVVQGLGRLRKCPHQLAKAANAPIRGKCKTRQNSLQQKIDECLEALAKRRLEHGQAIKSGLVKDGL